MAVHWSDEGIVLAARRHGETSAVASLLTREHGRHAGLVRGGAGKRARGALQPGNRLQVTWTARLDDQLGNFAWELASAAGTRWLQDADRLAALATACALVEAALPEREAHPGMFDALAMLLERLAGEDWADFYIRWELHLLAELGYGLDLARCAATGSNDNLAFVSPRSGRAVSLSAGEPYRDRLLALPVFLIEGSRAASRDDLRDGLALTGYFLERRVFGALGRPVPPARTRLVGRFKA